MRRMGMGVLWALFATGCAASEGDSFSVGDDDSAGDVDGDVDSDADTDADTDADSDSDSASDTGTDAVCDLALAEPTDLWLSADDSNSQAAPAWARRTIEEGGLIYRSQRLYEYLNYYSFDYAPAAAGSLRVVPELRRLEEEGDQYSLLVGVVSPSLESFARRPLAITFSVDSSGSMEGTGIEHAKDVMRATAASLRAQDVVSIVTWSTSSTVVLASEAVSGPNDPDVLDAIDAIQTGGSTDLNQGLVEAYRLAQEGYQAFGLNRVILISDGGANAGETHVELIAENADEGEQEGIFLVGVGVASNVVSYRDDLMDTVTDAGKGAYLFVDSAEEAEAMFGGDRFLQNLEIFARDVRLRMTLPGGWAIQEFHGEEISTDPEEVDPQHLAPNDAMLYHLDLVDCADHDGSEQIALRAEWQDASGAAASSETSAAVSELLAAEQRQVVKADAIVAYAKALSDVHDLPFSEQAPYLDGVIAQVRAALDAQAGDPDLAEVLGLLNLYRTHFE